MSTMAKQALAVILILGCIALCVHSLPAAESGRSESTSNNVGSRRLCGMRQFSAQAVTNAEFPWLVRLVTRPVPNNNNNRRTTTNNNGVESVLCSGSAVTPYTAIVSAHCVAGLSADRLMVAQTPLNFGRQVSAKNFNVVKLFVHPEFNKTSPRGEFDIAVVSIGHDDDGFGDSYACLPNSEDYPFKDCFEVAYPTNRTSRSRVPTNSSPIISNSRIFGPSLACLETPQMRGYIDDDSAILCSEELGQSCLSSGSPVFCASTVSKSQFEFVGLAAKRQDWCGLGVYTRTARHLDWILSVVDGLEGHRYQAGRGDEARQGEEVPVVQDTTPCAPEPCGEHAVCWNSGSRYMCTCDTEFPYGNPYYGCAKCIHDNHCNPGNTTTGTSKCVERVCVTPKPAPEVSSDYIDTGRGNLYYVSQEELPWPQAQYECLSRKGYLAELNDGRAPDESLLKVLRAANTTGRFWIGASDFEERGKFKWYYSGDQVSESNWLEMGGRPNPNATSDDDERCLQVGVDVGGRWAVRSCELKSRFICEHVSGLQDDQSIESLSGNDASNNRGERQRNFGDLETLRPTAHYAQICGRRFVRQREARIVGGGVAAYGEWPWQVSLRQYKNGQFRHKCGAALLTHEWIVTAAHCVKDVSASNLLVRIGEYNILDTSEAHEHINRRIAHMIPHEKFDKASYEYDIALLRVDEAIPFQPNMIPICLPNTDSDLVGEEGWVTGWGRKSEYGQISPVLREVHLPIISNAKCMAMYRMSGQNEWIPRIFLCAGTANGGQDSCEGDSGGPLVIKGNNGRFQLAGIISWGIGCGDRNRPGVYTRISEFRNWIRKHSGYEDRNRR